MASNNQILAKTIELWPIERLRAPSPKARTHSNRQVQEIAGSIATYGFMTALVVDSDGTIIVGNGRYQAARHLGLERVPVIVATHLSEVDKRAYALADNRIALNAGWDEDLLDAELAALASEGVDLLTLGFDESEFDALLANLSAESACAGEDAIPDVPAQAVTQMGDKWQMEDHRLLCADATSLDAYRELLDDELADTVFTDPPYNVNYQGGGTGTTTHRPIANDNLGNDFSAFLAAVCRNILSSTTGAVYICMSSSQLHTLYASFVDSEAIGPPSSFGERARSRSAVPIINGNMKRSCMAGRQTPRTIGAERGIKVTCG